MVSIVLVNYHSVEYKEVKIICNENMSKDRYSASIVDLFSITISKLDDIAFLTNYIVGLPI
jgi:hypothetical protein